MVEAMCSTLPYGTGTCHHGFIYYPFCCCCFCQFLKRNQIFFFFKSGIDKLEGRVVDTSISQPYVLFNEGSLDGLNLQKFVFDICKLCFVVFELTLND